MKKIRNNISRKILKIILKCDNYILNFKISHHINHNNNSRKILSHKAIQTIIKSS